MLNGKRNRVGIPGQKGWYVQAHPDDVRDQKTGRLEFGGECVSPDITKTFGKNPKKQESVSKIYFRGIPRDEYFAERSKASH